MRTIYIDCTGVMSSTDVWQRYIKATNPADAIGFGCNLDAFWDAVEGGGPGWPGEAKLVFTNSVELAPLLLRDGTSFLEALRRIAKEVTYTQIELA